jgi:hypothetical protein
MARILAQAGLAQSKKDKTTGFEVVPFRLTTSLSLSTITDPGIVAKIAAHESLRCFSSIADVDRHNFLARVLHPPH